MKNFTDKMITLLHWPFAKNSDLKHDINAWTVTARYLTEKEQIKLRVELKRRLKILK